MIPNKKLDKKQEALDVFVSTINIPEPSIKSVENALTEWESEAFEKYRKQENCLYYIFQKQFPFNTDINQIIAKVTILDSFYSTNVYYHLNVAEKIKDIQNLDWLLKCGNSSVVDKIRNIVIGNIKKVSKEKLGLSEENEDVRKEKDCYSFSTKFCSFHNPNDFQIYDKNCYKVLNHFFNNSKNETIKEYLDYIKGTYPSENNKTKFFNACHNYHEYLNIINCFTSAYGITGFSRKEIDCYLWITGKRYTDEL